MVTARSPKGVADAANHEQPGGVVRKQTRGLRRGIGVQRRLGQRPRLLGPEGLGINAAANGGAGLHHAVSVDDQQQKG